MEWIGSDPSKGLLIVRVVKYLELISLREAIETFSLENVEEKGRLPAFQNGFGIVPGEAEGCVIWPFRGTLQFYNFMATKLLTLLSHCSAIKTPAALKCWAGDCPKPVSEPQTLLRMKVLVTHTC